MKDFVIIDFLHICLWYSFVTICLNISWEMVHSLLDQFYLYPSEDEACYGVFIAQHWCERLAPCLNQRFAQGRLQGGNTLLSVVLFGYRLYFSCALVFCYYMYLYQIVLSLKQMKINGHKGRKRFTSILIQSDQSCTAHMDYVFKILDLAFQQDIVYSILQ